MKIVIAKRLSRFYTRTTCQICHGNSHHRPSVVATTTTTCPADIEMPQILKIPASQSFSKSASDTQDGHDAGGPVFN